MSLTQGPAPEQEPTPAVLAEARQKRLRRRLWAVCFALFPFEIGAFLLIFPWLDVWTLNHLPSLFPSMLAELQDLWEEPILKGAVSGLGLVNLYISFRQVASLLHRQK